MWEKHPGSSSCGEDHEQDCRGRRQAGIRQSQLRLLWEGSPLQEGAEGSGRWPSWVNVVWGRCWVITQVKCFSEKLVLYNRVFLWIKKETVHTDFSLQHEKSFSFSFSFCFARQGSVCNSLGCPDTCFVDQAGLCLQGVRIKGLYHHAWLENFLNILTVIS